MNERLKLKLLIDACLRQHFTWKINGSDFEIINLYFNFYSIAFATKTGTYNKYYVLCICLECAAVVL